MSCVGWLLADGAVDGSCLALLSGWAVRLWLIVDASPGLGLLRWAWLGLALWWYLVRGGGNRDSTRGCDGGEVRCVSELTGERELVGWARQYG